MKKAMNYFWLIAAAVVVFSCSKETAYEHVENPGTEVVPGSELDASRYLVSFGATFEGIDTKASIDLNNGSVSFKDGDEVLVVAGTESAVYVYSESEDNFTPESDAVSLAADVKAYYPAANYSFDGSSVTFTMPEATIENPGTLAPMCAEISGGVAAFKNLGAILRVNLTGAEPVTAIELVASAPIAGSSAVSWNEGDPEIGTLNGATNVKHSFPSAIEAGTEQTLYFFLPAGITTSLEVRGIYGKVGEVTYEPYKKISRQSALTTVRNKVISITKTLGGFFSAGDGSETNPYQIATADDFKAIATLANATANAEGNGYNATAKRTFFGSAGVHYVQTADIDFNNESLTPIGIGAGASAFSGTYDGDGKQLQNVNINVDTQFAAPFGYVNNGTIKNLTVSGIITKTGETDNSLSGGIAGILNGAAQITGCTNQATITSTATYTGGIAGRLYSSSASISNSHNSGSVSGVAYVGGIVGDQEGGKVYACENSGNVTASQAEAGGIAGRFQGGTIKACYSANGALISGASRVGGIAGYQSNQGRGASLVINCASKSQIKSTGDGNYGAAGGLVGYMYSAAEKGDVVLTNSVALGNGVFNTNQEDSYLGAIVGLVNGAAKLCYVRNCYSQHNSTTNTSAAVYYSADGSTITSTKGTNMGGIYGYLDRGTVQNCYCVGTDGVNGNGINTNAYAGAGTKTANGSTGNTRMVSNAVKNGTATVNASGWTIAVSSIKPTEMTAAYLVDVMNVGTWASASKDVRSSYISSEGTEEFVCNWVGLNETGPASYDPAYPSELKDLGTGYRP